MEYFGDRWDSWKLPSLKLVGTPVGVPCLHCEIPIALGDRGYITAVHRIEGPTTEPAHRECSLRAVVGGVGHLLGVCHCPGKAGLWEDPPSLNRYEAAKVVWDLIQTGKFDEVS